MMDYWQLEFTHQGGRAFCDVLAGGRLLYRLPPYWLDRAKALVDQHNDRAAVVRTHDRARIAWPNMEQEYTP